MASHARHIVCGAFAEHDRPVYPALARHLCDGPPPPATPESACDAVDGFRHRHRASNRHRRSTPRAIIRSKNNARRSVSRVLSPLARGMAIHLRRPSPDAWCDQPGRPARKPTCREPCGPRRAAPIRSCSRWGLPCRRRYRRRGALLPHPFTLARQPRHRGVEAWTGGLLSVALSLGSPPPGVTRHRVPVEPGLSSPRLAPKGGHPTVWRL